MDKRSLVALVLIALVIVGGQLLMPRSPAPVLAIDTSAPSSAVQPTSSGSADTSARVAAPPSRPPTVSAAPATSAAVASAQATPAVRPETAVVSAPGRIARFVTPGAVPASVTLPEYPDLRLRSGALSITPLDGPLMRFRIVNDADTIRLDNLAFTKTQTASTVEFRSKSPDVRVRYEMAPENYLTHTRITLGGAAPGALLLIDLAPNLQSGEADQAEDLRHLAYGFKKALGDVESITMGKLDTAQTIVEPGPLDWVAIRNKYFVFAILSSDSAFRFSELLLRGGPRKADKLPTGLGVAVMPLSPSGASFDLYTGPQSWATLRAVGHDLSNVNPYAGWAWLRPIVEPFATIVMRALLGLKAAVGLSYGWVLVIFGIGIRLLLWPLNQSAMRTSIKMQRLQPELAALQKKYGKDPEGQRTAMMKLYADHGMSPFSPLMGCLPMLIPMPILFALYFVFQNTIEFRGVPFLWLPDISLKDPYYITPIVMGASMLVLSWIGMRAAPPNPQAKIMGYMMPAMFTMMFLNFASGLNMYYAVQNLVAIPQQWLLTRERARATGATAPTGSPAVNKRR